MPKKRSATGDAIEIMHRRYYEGKPDRIAALEEARADDEVARKIYQLRTQAGLSQRKLAKLVGTTASVICRLEDAEITKAIPCRCFAESPPPSTGGLRFVSYPFDASHRSQESTEHCTNNATGDRGKEKRIATNANTAISHLSVNRTRSIRMATSKGFTVPHRLAGSFYRVSPRRSAKSDNQVRCSPPAC
jgi:hypothetical protein